MPTCYGCYIDFISCGNTTLRVIGKLEPYAAYIWRLENKGASYGRSAVTDANGMFTIIVSDLPEALLNPYAGPFTLSVRADDAYQCADEIWNNSAYCDPYDCIQFEVVNGSFEKNTLGCPCPII